MYLKVSHIWPDKLPKMLKRQKVEDCFGTNFVLKLIWCLGCWEDHMFINCAPPPPYFLNNFSKLWNTLLKCGATQTKTEFYNN